VDLHKGFIKSSHDISYWRETEPGVMVCEAKFIQSDNLKTHLFTHSGKGMKVQVI